MNTDMYTENDLGEDSYGEETREESIIRLITTILRGKKSYYEGKPIISDYMYDEYEARLKKLAGSDHWVLNMVGYDPELAATYGFYVDDTYNYNQFTRRYYEFKT